MHSILQNTYNNGNKERSKFREELLKQKVMQHAASAARGAKIPEEQRWPVH